MMATCPCRTSLRNGDFTTRFFSFEGAEAAGEDMAMEGRKKAEGDRSVYVSLCLCVHCRSSVVVSLVLWSVALRSAAGGGWPLPLLSDRVDVSRRAKQTLGLVGRETAAGTCEHESNVNGREARHARHR